MAYMYGVCKIHRSISPVANLINCFIIPFITISHKDGGRNAVASWRSGLPAATLDVLMCADCAGCLLPVSDNVICNYTGLFCTSGSGDDLRTLKGLLCVTTVATFGENT